MKSLLVLSLFLGAALAAPQPHPAVKTVFKPSGFKPATLLEDLLDIVALLPFHDLHEILDEHLATDGALSAVVGYLQGDDFKQFWADIISLPESVDYIGYLTDHGVPIAAINTIVAAIIDGLVPGVEPDMSGSLRPLLDEIEAVLPVDDILALINDKMQNSADFQDWYVEASSEDMHALVDEVLQMDEQLYIQGVLETFGVDYLGFWEGIYNYFGWGEPPINSK